MPKGVTLGALGPKGVTNTALATRLVLIEASGPLIRVISRIIGAASRTSRPSEGTPVRVCGII